MPPPHAQTASPAPDVVIRGTGAKFVQHATSGRHQFSVDEPISLGGTDTAATPYDLLLAALGSCTSMTIGLYARRKGIPLENISVSLWHSKIHATDCDECETRQGRIDRIEVAIDLTGPLTEEQRAKLLEIAKICPVHRTLTSEINVRFK
jgi:putative redox protein